MPGISFKRRGLQATFTVLALLMSSLPSIAQGQLVTIVIVRHPEIDNSKASEPVVPLSAAGRERAALLAHTFEDVKFTHMLGSHTTRSRESIEVIAAKKNLPIVLLPTPDSIVDGEHVTDQTSRRAAIEPVASALKELPRGSVALVALNSENVYAVLNKLGVPEAQQGQSCALGSMCVPCTNNTCFPRSDFDRIWYLVRDPGRIEPVAYFEFRYGAGWRSTDR
jgi:phosphohistidine phosphatase SixA